MKDMKGFAFNEGCTVTQIKDGRLYLDDSKQPMKFPERLLIIEQDKLYRMMKQHEDANE